MLHQNHYEAFFSCSRDIKGHQPTTRDNKGQTAFGRLYICTVKRLVTFKTASMALKFKKVARKVLSGNEKGTIRYYAVAKSAGLSGVDKICKLISARSTVSSADVKAVFDSLVWAMDMELSSGNAVQLGELGNFRLSVSSQGMATKEEVNASKIKKARIIFSPGAILRNTRQNVSFEALETEVEEKECNRSHID
jgi:predicted histone-like DNA-binding protein